MIECICAQTRPQFILIRKSFRGMDSEPILTPREKSLLPEKNPSPRRIEPTTLHQEGQRAQRTTNEPSGRSELYRIFPAGHISLDRMQAGQEVNLAYRSPEEFGCGQIKRDECHACPHTASSDLCPFSLAGQGHCDLIHTSLALVRRDCLANLSKDAN